MESHIASIANYDEKRFAAYVRGEKLEKLHQIKLYADDLYHNQGITHLSDDQYDSIKDALEERDPGYTQVVGAKIRKGDNRVELPFWLGSMDKIKIDPELERKTVKQTEELLVNAERVLGSLTDSGEIQNQLSLIESLQRIAWAVSE